MDAQPVVQLDLRGAHVRDRRSPGADGDQRIRLLGPGGQDAAGTVILETAANQPDVVRQQRRGERVAAQPLQPLAVEGETNRLSPETPLPRDPHAVLSRDASAAGPAP